MPKTASPRPEIVLIHQEGAHLPELAAYPDVLRERFDVRDSCEPGEAGEQAILWFFMGFYPARTRARLVIHDYRSLSIGRFAAAKDLLKRLLQPKPDLRIFLNQAVQRRLGFRDNGPALTLDMGVPDWIGQYRSSATGIDRPRYGFCYVGESSRERGTDRMLAAFLRSPYRSRGLVLIGRCETAVRRRFEGAPDITFAGVLPQRELFTEICGCDYAVSHFPAHRPHDFQTPTKLLEYAALGKRIIANRSPSNVRTARNEGISIVWAGDDIFDDLQIGPGDPDNADFDYRDITWSARFARSGILERLDARFGPSS